MSDPLGWENGVRADDAVTIDGVRSGLKRISGQCSNLISSVVLY